MPDKSKEKLLKEAAKMMKMPQGSQESSIIQTYLDTCLELPWLSLIHIWHLSFSYNNT